jgi:hypothetical protein
VIGAKIQADTGSVIRATGDLTLGRVLASALVLRGRIEGGAGTVILQDGHPVTIEGELVIGGGLVLSGNLLIPTIAAGGRLEGHGRVGVGLNVAGTVAPGEPAGRLGVIGTLLLNLGTYEADLGNHAAGEWDSLEASGDAALGGTLALHRLASYDAAPGDSFAILVCNHLVGTFANVTLDGQPLAGELEVHYASNAVWIVVPQSTVDVDGGTPGPAPVVALQLAPLASPGQRPGVELALPSAARASVRAYDVSGREVALLHDGELGPGRHRFELRREAGGAGMYFVRATIDDASGRLVKTVRVVRLR